MQLERDGYAHDVFVSYPHQEEHRIWVQEVFRNIFELHLTNELGRPAAVFVDRKGIGSGDAWPERLKQALAHSRVLVPIWSINYFWSDWCMAECSVMLTREQKLGYRTRDNPRGLIHPVKLFDGHRYPPFARKIEPFDCTEFNLIGDDYKKTPQYFELQRKLKDWVPQVAEAIEGVPTWDDAFQSKEWLEDPIRQWIAEPEFRFPQHPFRPPSLAEAVA